MALKLALSIQTDMAWLHAVKDNPAHNRAVLINVMLVSFLVGLLSGCGDFYFVFAAF